MKLTPQSRIVFIGDSITDAERARPVGEGRPGTLGTGYVSQIDAALAVRYPQHQFRLTNMGISAQNIREVAARWQTDVLDLKPDYVSLMVGVNDAWRVYGRPLFVEQQVPVAEYAKVLDGLMERTLPVVKGVVLMTPFYVEPRRDEPMRALLDGYGEAVRQAAKRWGATLVDAQAAFDRVMEHRHPLQLSGDRIHPYLVGHVLLAEAWLAACC